jgi:hypothetical protein
MISVKHAKQIHSIPKIWNGVILFYLDLDPARGTCTSRLLRSILLNLKVPHIRRIFTCGSYTVRAAVNQTWQTGEQSGSIPARCGTKHPESKFPRASSSHQTPSTHCHNSIDISHTCTSFCSDLLLLVGVEVKPMPYIEDIQTLVDDYYNLCLYL